MISYGSNLELKKPLPELLKIQKPEEKGFLYYLHSFLDFVGEVVIDVISEAVTIATFGNKFIGETVELVLGFVKDVIIDLAIYQKVDWKNVLVNAAWRLGTIAFMNGLRKTKNFIKQINKGKYAKTISKTTNFVKKSISFIKNPQSLYKYFLNKVSYKIQKTFFKSTKWSKIQIKKIKKIIKNIINYGTYWTSFGISFYKADDKAKFLFSRTKNLARIRFKKLTKKITKDIYDKRIKNLAKKNPKNIYEYQKIMKQHNQTWIQFYDSNWIDGLKIASTDWIENKNEQFLSYYVFFNRLTTNNKNALLFIDRPIEEFNNFINSSSKGKYYLDNLAWGWNVGKAIRNQNKTGKSKFWISKLEKTANKYDIHFLKSIREFDKTSNTTIETFRNQFKVLSSTRNRKLGNRIAVEFNNKKVVFYKKKNEEQFNKTFKNFNNIKRTSKGINLIIKKPKRL
ncbi:hypothetical protein [Mycoplasmopsis lipofaciens]|uniref:hypothetical protein n=1 Tax=Mycoplasmopsis lipofaciens TaxID=114884 RepID=UPI000482F7F5|nr:hypothetical protein [Mycoplasmopsis lipofaciens]